MRILLVLLAFLASLPASASVLSGEIVGAREHGIFRWGDDEHSLRAMFTNAHDGLSGWFQKPGYFDWSDYELYGIGPTNATIYDAGIGVDPLTVANAHLFDYWDGVLEIYEGHTVFIRGINDSWDFYGALVLHDFRMVPCGESCPKEMVAVLDATWYFHDRGNGNFRMGGRGVHTFSLAAIPESGTAALVAMGLVAMAAERGRRKPRPLHLPEGDH